MLTVPAYSEDCFTGEINPKGSEASYYESVVTQWSWLEDVEPKEVYRYQRERQIASYSYKQLMVDNIDITPQLKGQLKDLVAEYSNCFFHSFQFKIRLSRFKTTSIMEYRKSQSYSKLSPSPNLTHGLWSGRYCQPDTISNSAPTIHMVVTGIPRMKSVARFSHS